MIVFDLKCSDAGHVFEAWFSSSEAYEDQKVRKLLICPVCGDGDIGKATMAPNIGQKSNARSAGSAVTAVNASATDDQQAKALLSAMAAMQLKLLENSTWVGTDFDRQARAMDSGDIDKSTIHGKVSAEEAADLLADGIGVLPLPFPVVPLDKQN